MSKKFLVASESKIKDRDDLIHYRNFRVVEAMTPEGAEQIYANIHQVKNSYYRSKCICRMYDDEPSGVISEKRVFAYLSDVTDKLNRVYDHITTKREDD